MTLLFQRRGLGDSPNQLVPSRTPSGRAPGVRPGDDLHTSVAWAAVRLRADLISSLPVDAYRRVDGVPVALPNPTVLQTPGALHLDGKLARVDEWLYATQVDLDRYGNTFGFILDRDPMMRPTRIDLVPASSVSVRVTKAKGLQYRIGGTLYDPADIWHERQYVVTGMPVGLSVIAHADWSLGTYKSAQEFAAQWFNAGVIPSAVLRNSEKVLTPQQTDEAKTRVNATVKAGEILVAGKDWEFDLIAVPAVQKQFLEAMGASAGDLARFYNVPGDLIDVAVSGQSVTYANLTQRNLQLLIMHLGPAIKRREDALSALLAQPRFVKLNSGALLRMDPLTRAQMNEIKVRNRALTPDEWRAQDDLPPLTPEQVAHFDVLLGKPTQPAAAGPTAPTGA